MSAADPRGTPRLGARAPALAAANNKLAQVDSLVARRRDMVSLGMPAFPDAAGPRQGARMIPPATLAAGLRNHAEGSCCLTAAAELLIAQSWLDRPDFTSRFITVHPGTGGGQPVAVINWPAVITALETSLPCSGGEQRMLKITASLADGIPVDLRDTVTGLDDRNIQLLLTAIRCTAGKPSRAADIHDRL